MESHVDELMQSIVDAYSVSRQQHLCATPTAPSVSHLQSLLRQLSELQQQQLTAAAAMTRQSNSSAVYACIHCLAQLSTEIMTAEDSSSSPHDASPLLEAALVNLANLCEDSSGRQLLQRALHCVSATNDDDDCAPTLPELLLKRVLHSSVGDSVGSSHETTTFASQAPATATPARSVASYHQASATPHLARQKQQQQQQRLSLTPIGHTCVRLLTSLLLHAPLLLPASSYAALAPATIAFLLCPQGDGCSGGGDGVKGTDAELAAAVGLLAACVRGSPHFRDYVRGCQQVTQGLRLS